MAEHAMLDLVPLAGSRWEMAHVDGSPQAARQLLQRHFPQTAAATVAATPVGHDQQLPGMRITLGAHLVPPTADGLRGIVIHADTHPPLILTPIGHAYRGCVRH